MKIEEMDNCPKCNYSFKGKDILEYFKEARDDKNHNQHEQYKNHTDEELLEVASLFGYTKENPKTFSTLIGIEVQGDYDGVKFWQCPKCNTKWNRFSVEEVV